MRGLPPGRQMRRQPRLPGQRQDALGRPTGEDVGGDVRLQIRQRRDRAHHEGVVALLEGLLDGRIDYHTEGDTLVRVSAPEGASDWAQEAAEGANSFVGRDKLVKWPLAILWYSGDLDRFLPPFTDLTHIRSPYPLVQGGRMFMFTHEVLHAIDIYTGNYLWSRKIPKTPYVNTRHFLNRLYGKPTELRKESRILIINRLGIVAGLLVDEVYGLRRFKPEEHQKQVMEDAGALVEYLAGTFVDQVRRWNVFSVEKLAGAEQFLRVV